MEDNNVFEDEEIASLVDIEEEYCKDKDKESFEEESTINSNVCNDEH